MWGHLNAFELPIFIRPFIYKFYSKCFNCNLDEMDNQDLKSYKNLGEFFYRTLKPGVRPIDENALLVSPADGRILHFGLIDTDTRQVEQVKGMTYSLDALLGTKPINLDDTSDSESHRSKQSSINSTDTIINITNDNENLISNSLNVPCHSNEAHKVAASSHSEHLSSGKEFAEINSVKYSLFDFLGEKQNEVTQNFTDRKSNEKPSKSHNDSGYDSSENNNNNYYKGSSSNINDTLINIESETEEESNGSSSRNSSVNSSYDSDSSNEGRFGNYIPRFVSSLWNKKEKVEDKQLFFCVIYLAPGDYHHFHSPANWDIYKRRHFAGELYSVSPMMANMLKNLFVLNERVVLFGQWQHGFFSMIPVGATNVGSIKIDFDTQLKTNSKKILNRFKFSKFRSSSSSSYEPIPNDDEDNKNETTNSKSIPIEPKNHVEPGSYVELVYKHVIKMNKGDEMGGFKLGSTVVLVFEAPKNFVFNINPDQKVKVGERLGGVVN